MRVKVMALSVGFSLLLLSFFATHAQAKPFYEGKTVRIYFSEAIKKAMKLGIEAAVKVPGVSRISAGNYGGKLGKFQYKLNELGLEL